MYQVYLTVSTKSSRDISIVQTNTKEKAIIVIKTPYLVVIMLNVPDVRFTTYGLFQITKFSLTDLHSPSRPT